jgi:hypothetical protein
MLRCVRCGRAPISPPMIISLPQLMQDVWQRALPGRECAERNEVLRADIEPTPAID